jgi:hypothetical protein
MNAYKVKRDSNGWVLENCPVNVGVKIGSFDCTAKCPHNQNTPQEIKKYGFDIPEIKCAEFSKLPKENEQLILNI